MSADTIELARKSVQFFEIELLRPFLLGMHRFADPADCIEGPDFEVRLRATEDTILEATCIRLLLLFDHRNVVGETQADQHMIGLIGERFLLQDRQVVIQRIATDAKVQELVVAVRLRIQLALDNVVVRVSYGNPARHRERIPQDNNAIGPGLLLFFVLAVRPHSHRVRREPGELEERVEI